MDIQRSAFGVGDHDPRMFTERYYPLHSKGLTKSRLRDPVLRFNEIFAEKVHALTDQVQNSPAGYVDISIVSWVLDSMFDAGLGAIYGMEFVKKARARTPMTLQDGHNTFDVGFPLLAAGLLPGFVQRFIKPVRDGLMARDDVVAALAEFVEEGCPGLEDGLIFETTQLFIKENLTPSEIGHLILGDLWALQGSSISNLIASLLGLCTKNSQCSFRLRCAILQSIPGTWSC